MPNPGISSTATVDVIIATRDRPRLLRLAIDSILQQDYLGRICIFVVYDNSDHCPELVFDSENRGIRVLENLRTAGLPGSRNTGLLESEAPLVAFCDDDDLWRPQKLRRQVELLVQQKASGCVSGIEVHYGDRKRVRLPKVDRITATSLSGSRLTGAHPSTYLFDRDYLLTNVGLVDEELPYGYGEDYDLLLRAAQHGLIAVLPEVTADILWHQGGSYFSQRWEAMAAGLGYLMKKHPSITQNRKGAAWMEGQRAFALASMGNQRVNATRSSYHSLKLSVREPRAYLALAIILGLVKPATILHFLNARGRGI